MIQNKKFKTIRYVFILMFTLAFSLGIGILAYPFTQHLFTGLQADIFSSQKVPIFDGTTMPIRKIPDWLILPSNMWESEYNEIESDMLINIPFYEPKQLKIALNTLNSANEYDQKTLMAKYTYIISYLGTYLVEGPNYVGDGLEYTGSHTGVDIRTPLNTPVYAIGNGIVTKVSFQETGFGHHIVIKHIDFPSLEDPIEKTTYYSTYSHLNSIEVGEGVIVKKGQQIGLTGKTGNATVPHLHFQIDKENAPWHPYWPFSEKEANSLGYTTHEAVNAALGKEKGLITTINPLLYVQKYLDWDIKNTFSESNLRGSAEEIKYNFERPKIRSKNEAIEVRKKRQKYARPLNKTMPTLEINSIQ